MSRGTDEGVPGPDFQARLLHTCFGRPQVGPNMCGEFRAWKLGREPFLPPRKPPTHFPSKSSPSTFVHPWKAEDMPEDTDDDDDDDKPASKKLK